MGFKCAIQLKGLTRGEPKPGSKHRMTIRSAAMEAGYERASRSDTLDRTRSKLNIYEGFTKGKECADRMEEESEFVKVTMKDGTVRERKARSDAVPGFAAIINPPWEVSKEWTRDQQLKFYQDSWECLKTVKPNIFRDENIVMKAEHFDEGVPPVKDHDLTIEDIDPHLHIIGYARDENGKWVGNEIDGKFLHDLNVVYPQMMRDRGWGMDDLDVTDFDRAKVDEAYREERNQKRKKSGLSVNKHLSRKSKETRVEIENMLDDVEKLHEETEAMRDEIKKTKLEIEKEKTELNDREKKLDERILNYNEVQEKNQNFIRNFKNEYKAIYKEMSGEEFPSGEPMSVDRTKYAQDKFRERSKKQSEEDAKKIKEEMIKEANAEIENERAAATKKIQDDRSKMEEEIEKRKEELEAKETELKERKKELEDQNREIADELTKAISEVKEISEDADASRKKFMEKQYGASGISMEEYYQKELRDREVKRRRTLDNFSEIADRYDQEHGGTDLSSLERQYGD